MATVYRGRHPELNRTVALKVLDTGHFDMIKRFEREAFLSATMKQENLPTVYDYFSDNGNNYLVIEYVEGTDLNKLIKLHKTMPPMIVAMIVREIARGLEHVHEKGIIHRDIKPGNVRIATDGSVKLMDFGISKEMEEGDFKFGLTRTGIIVGTPSYMSPEQAAGDRITTQSDIFSLGVMMYEMLAGSKPFRAKANSDLLALIVKGHYKPLRQVDRSIPRKLVHIASTALHKNRHLRYPTISEFIKDLNRFINNASQTEIKSAVKAFFAGTYKPSGNGNRKKKLLSIGGLSLAAALLASVLYWLPAQEAGPYSALIRFRSDNNAGIGTALNDAFHDVRVFVNDREVDRRKLADADRQILVKGLKEGANQLLIQMPSAYATYYTNLFVDENNRTPIEFNLDKIFTLSSEYNINSERFSLAVNTNPAGARVMLGNEYIGDSGPGHFKRGLVPGKYLLTVQKEGFKPFQKEVEVKRHQDVEMYLELSRVEEVTDSWYDTAFWIGLALLLLLL